MLGARSLRFKCCPTINLLCHSLALAGIQLHYFFFLSELLHNFYGRVLQIVGKHHANSFTIF